MGNDPVLKVKKLFFREDRVTNLADRKRKRALSRAGSFVRRSAKFSMKSRKGSAPPGSPPYKHKRKLLDRLLFFSYDESNKSVVVGPVIFDEAKEKGVPALLEKGGSIIRMIRDKPEKHVYEKRPYMQPALMENQGKIAQGFA